jgi:hypothetical protein
MLDAGSQLYFVGILGGVLFVVVTVAAMWINRRRI